MSTNSLVPTGKPGAKGNNKTVTSPNKAMSSTASKEADQTMSDPNHRFDLQNLMVDKTIDFTSHFPTERKDRSAIGFECSRLCAAEYVADGYDFPNDITLHLKSVQALPSVADLTGRKEVGAQLNTFPFKKGGDHHFTLHPNIAVEDLSLALGQLTESEHSSIGLLSPDFDTMDDTARHAWRYKIIHQLEAPHLRVVKYMVIREILKIMSEGYECAEEQPHSSMEVELPDLSRPDTCPEFIPCLSWDAVPPTSHKRKSSPCPPVSPEAVKVSKSQVLSPVISSTGPSEVQSPAMEINSPPASPASESNKADLMDQEEPDQQDLISASTFVIPACFPMDQNNNLDIAHLHPHQVLQHLSRAYKPALALPVTDSKHIYARKKLIEDFKQPRHQQEILQKFWVWKYANMEVTLVYYDESLARLPRLISTLTIPPAVAEWINGVDNQSPVYLVFIPDKGTIDTMIKLLRKGYTESEVAEQAVRQSECLSVQFTYSALKTLTSTAHDASYITTVGQIQAHFKNDQESSYKDLTHSTLRDHALQFLYDNEEHSKEMSTIVAEKLYENQVWLYNNNIPTLDSPQRALLYLPPHSVIRVDDLNEVSRHTWHPGISTFSSFGSSTLRLSLIGATGVDITNNNTTSLHGCRTASTEQYVIAANHLDDSYSFHSPQLLTESQFTTVTSKLIKTLAKTIGSAPELNQVKMNQQNSAFQLLLTNHKLSEVETTHVAIAGLSPFLLYPNDSARVLLAQDLSTIFAGVGLGNFFLCASQIMKPRSVELFKVTDSNDNQLNSRHAIIISLPSPIVTTDIYRCFNIRRAAHQYQTTGGEVLSELHSIYSKSATKSAVGVVTAASDGDVSIFYTINLLTAQQANFQTGRQIAGYKSLSLNSRTLNGITKMAATIIKTSSPAPLTVLVTPFLHATTGNDKRISILSTLAIVVYTHVHDPEAGILVQEILKIPTTTHDQKYTSKGHQLLGDCVMFEKTWHLNAFQNHPQLSQAIHPVRALHFHDLHLDMTPVRVLQALQEAGFPIHIIAHAFTMGPHNMVVMLSHTHRKIEIPELRWNEDRSQEVTGSFRFKVLQELPTPAKFGGTVQRVAQSARATSATTSQGFTRVAQQTDRRKSEPGFKTPGADKRNSSSSPRNSSGGAKQNSRQYP